LKLYLGKSDQGDILIGIYSNTVWAIQQKSIKDELLGSSDGTALQRFQLKNNPVFDVNVWVREPFLPKSDEEYYEDKYQQGYWLAYREIDHLFNAHVDERVFWLNSNEGVIHFGDGEEGKIPPLARDNIRVSYRYGGGAKSNGEASSIKKLLSTLPSIQKVSNPLAITGGADQEPIAELIEKAPANIRHHNRAVCERDIEALVYKVSRSIGRAKLFLKPQGFGEQYLVVVPRDSRAMPQASLNLREKIESYLESRISATSSIEVVSPEYLLVHVRATLHTKTPALADSIYQTALRQLENYLHPLTGKPNQQGWAFGESITLSDVLGWLEEIEQVEYISDIEILLQSGEEQELLNEVNNHYLNLPPYALLASGEHTIKVKEV
jgi:predicted phage baseplate assembly protein